MMHAWMMVRMPMMRMDDARGCAVVVDAVNSKNAVLTMVGVTRLARAAVRWGRASRRVEWAEWVTPLSRARLGFGVTPAGYRCRCADGVTPLLPELWKEMRFAHLHS